VWEKTDAMGYPHVYADLRNKRGNGHIAVIGSSAVRRSTSASPRLVRVVDASPDDRKF